MALLFSSVLVSPSNLSLPSYKNTTKTFARKPPKCLATTTTTTTTTDHDLAMNRRSGHYPPTVWDYDFLKTLTSDYTEEKYVHQVAKLKEEVKNLISGDMDDESLAKLELIDSVQRLGLKYQFEKEIKNAVDKIYNESHEAWLSSDLYSTALRFRIFRQHGYDVPQDVFQRFKDEMGNFKSCLSEDVKGLLSLYEASFFGFQGEDIIDEAKAFATTNLKTLKGKISPPIMARKVNHALDMPLHWTLPRVEARWFIDTYEQERNMNPNLLKMAKLDYNIVQSGHQKEVNKLARWWMDFGLVNICTFARDRLLEHYFWCHGMASEPQYQDMRDMSTKVICLITAIDDFYDVYGSLDEIEIFTNLVDRWDIKEIDKLPYNIRILFLALFNMTNDIGYWTLKEREFNILPFLTRQWANWSKTALQEAKWFHGGYKPTVEEYLDNAVVSVAAPLMLFCAYFLTTDKITVEALNYIDKFPSIMRCSSMITRLADDLGTSSHELERGDVPKVVQCYMNDTGATEEIAREYIKSLIHETWKKINKDMLSNDYPFSEPFLYATLNFGRTAQWFYQFGDGHGYPGGLKKDLLFSLVVEPLIINS